MDTHPIGYTSTSTTTNTTAPEFIFKPTTTIRNEDENPSSKTQSIFNDNQPTCNLFHGLNPSVNFNIDQSNVRQILCQPISTLRCNRNRREMATGDVRPTDRLEQSDLLDYIDSIPIDTLEKRLLCNKMNTEIVPSSSPSNSLSRHNLPFKSDRQQSLSPSYTDDKDIFPHHSKHHLPIELKKPLLESPSPPKMYRMNMF